MAETAPRTPIGEYHQIQFEGVLSQGIEDAQGINTVVAAFRHQILTDYFGYTPPLLLDDNPNRYITTAIEQQRVHAGQLPAAQFYGSLVHYPGTTGNFAIELSEPDRAKMKVKRGIDFDASTAFEVSADLISLGGAVEGRVQREYTLYAVAREDVLKAQVPYKLFKHIYSKDTLHSEHMLLVQSAGINQREWKQTVFNSAMRHEQAVSRGQSLASSATVYRGGLPSQGRNAR